MDIVEPRTYKVPVECDYIDIKSIYKKWKCLPYGHKPKYHSEYTSLKADYVGSLGKFYLPKPLLINRPNSKTTVWTKIPTQKFVKWPKEFVEYRNLVEYVLGMEKSILSENQWYALRVRVGIDVNFVKKGKIHRIGNKPHQDCPRILKDFLRSSIYSIYNCCPTIFSNKKPVNKKLKNTVSFLNETIVNYSGQTWHVGNRMLKTDIRQFVVIQCDIHIPTLKYLTRGG